jgi:hypothetical protein
MVYAQRKITNEHFFLGVKKRHKKKCRMLSLGVVHEEAKSVHLCAFQNVSPLGVESKQKPKINASFCVSPKKKCSLCSRRTGYICSENG